MEGHSVIIPLPPGMSEDQYWEVQNGMLNISIVFASVLAVVAWDFILLIPDEIRLYKTKGIWRRAAPWAFVVLRYSVLVPSIAALFFSSIRTSHCEVASAISWTGATLVTISGGLIFCIRVIVLWHGNKPVMMVVGAMYLVMVSCWIAVAVQAKVGTEPPARLFANCNQRNIPSTASLSYASSVAFDLVVVILTLMRIPRPPPTLGATSQRPIAGVMYRDTLAYFISVTLVNIIILAIESLSGSSIRIQLLKPLFIPFSTACTAILASRIFLNLRNTANAPCGTEEHSLSSSLFGWSLPADSVIVSRIAFADRDGIELGNRISLPAIPKRAENV